MTNSIDPWLSLLRAAVNLEGEPNTRNENTFRDALQASLRQEQQRTRERFGTDSLALYHGEWQAGNNRGAFSLKLGSQRDETLSTSIELAEGRVATVFVDLSRVGGQLAIHGQEVLAVGDSVHESEVSLYRPDGSTDATTLDADGEFSFHLPGTGAFGLEILLHSGEVLQLDDITVEM